MPQPNWGLLASMSEGIKSGLIGYQTMKEAQRNEEMGRRQDRLQQMQMMKEGIVEGPGGLLALSPEKQAEQAAETDYKRAQADFYRSVKPAMMKADMVGKGLISPDPGSPLAIRQTQEAAKAAADIEAARRKNEQPIGGLLSVKEVEPFTDIDNAESDIQNLIQKVQANPSLVGLDETFKSSKLVGPEKAQFRSAVGKLSDAYRKAITGAGAGKEELETIMSRNPQDSDKYENFVAKANEWLNELGRKRSILLSNYEKAGKDISKFKKAPKEETREVDGVKYRKVKGGWEEVE